MEYERLHHNLKLLDLITFESILDNYLEMATKDSKSTIEILDYLVSQEVQSKEARSLSRSEDETVGISRGKEARRFRFQISTIY